MIRFLSDADKSAVLHNGPYVFNNRPVVIKPWTPAFNFHKEILTHVPLWVRFPNLPLNCWTSGSLSRICSVLGAPLCADSCTTNQLRISFARVLIEMDITKPLPKTIHIVDPTGQTFEQGVWYEWTPPFCHKCNKMGHKCSDPDGAKTKPKKQKSHGKPMDPKAAEGAVKWIPKVVDGAPDPVTAAGPSTSLADVVPACEPAPSDVPVMPAIAPVFHNVVSSDAIVMHTPCNTLQVFHGEDDDGWKRVTKGSKERLLTKVAPVVQSNAYLALAPIAEDSGEVVVPLAVRDSPLSPG